VLRNAVVNATLATSIANSQPWHFHLSEGQIDVFADWARQLPNLDPVGRHLTMSVGCAVFNARVVLAHAGLPVRVSLTPDPSHTDLMVRIETREDAAVEPIGHLFPNIEARRPAGDDFVAEAFPEHLRPALTAAAATEGTGLTWVDSADHMAQLDQFARRAAQIQTISRGGSPDIDLKHAMAEYWTAMTDAPIGSVAILSVTEDDPAGWIRAGAALQRLLLEVTEAGFVALPQGGPIEVPAQRTEVRALLDLDSQPVLALVIGTGSGKQTLRRRLVEVLTES
jgi:nitroreductase